tara:strand:- start:371 stop:688 length:318 start_codon:yes stop_codon:yes gene_type:complete
MIEYILLGVFSPIILNLMHLVLGIWITVVRGSVIGLGFSAVGFVTKTIGMLFLTWLGIGYLNLEVGIYIPLLTFFWFFTHVVEGVVIRHYMEQNVPEYLQKIQIK